MTGHAEAAAELLRSLAHPQRLLTLCALRDGERTVGELRAALGGTQAGTSQQLMRLRADGLVASRREGSRVHYRIERPEVLRVLETLHDVLCAHRDDAAAAPAHLPRGRRLMPPRFVPVPFGFLPY